MTWPRRAYRRLRNDLLGSAAGVATNEPLVALTFDDGPHPVHTRELLRVLASHDARATFFMLGVQALALPDVVDRVAAAGHAIGNHSFDHPSFPLIASRERQRQLRACQAALGPHGRRRFRPPCGHASLSSHLDVRRLGYEVVTWSRRALPWSGPGEWSRAGADASPLRKAVNVP